MGRGKRPAHRGDGEAGRETRLLEDRGSDDEGDAFRGQHQLRTVSDREVDGVRRSVLVNEAESPLGWLKSRKDRNGRPLITDDQYQAGESLRGDYWVSHLTPRA